MDARNYDGLEIAPAPSLINKALKPKISTIPAKTQLGKLFGISGYC